MSVVQNPAGHRYNIGKVACLRIGSKVAAKANAMPGFFLARWKPEAPSEARPVVSFRWRVRLHFHALWTIPWTMNHPG
jgi:hypothetical protein